MMETATETTMQVRAHRPAGGDTCFYFTGVTPERAVELARHHAWARCIPVAWFEVREGATASLNEPPILTAPAESERS